MTNQDEESLPETIQAKISANTSVLDLIYLTHINEVPQGVYIIYHL